MTKSRVVSRLLLFVVVVTLVPALGLTIGTTITEVTERSDYLAADRYPAAEPTVEQRATLTAVTTALPMLGAEWRWAELDVCGMTFHRSRIVLLDPDMDCSLVATIAHEWGHLASIVYYGGDQTPEGSMISDVVDESTGRPYKVSVQEIVADCISVLLLDEMGLKQPARAYLPRVGGCPPDIFALASDIVTSAGARLTPGNATSLAAIGHGVV